MRACADRGTGLIGSVAGLLVVLLLLAFAAELLLGRYATTVVRATLHDAAARAAGHRVDPTPAALDRLAEEAETSLGRMGDRTSIVLWVEDTTGDGLPDVVVGEAVGEPPRLVPPSIGGPVGAGEIRVGVRVRIERPR